MKKLFSILLLGIVLLMGSCEKFLDCELCNVDPNDPTTTTPALLLPVIEVGTFSIYGGQLGRLSALFTQQVAGTDFQFQEFAVFDIAAQDLNNEWNTIYADILINCKELVDAFGEGNPRYTGIAKVLWAMNLGLAADMWGDVPFTESLQGTDNLAPVYDAQQTVLNGVQTLLDEAIVALQIPDSNNLSLPTTDDYIYGGDADAWLSVAYVLKARYANRLSKVDASGSATDVLAHLTNAYAAGFTSTSSDMNAIFGAAGNELNQWYGFQTQRSNYIKMGENLINLMSSINDPRLSFYATTDGGGGFSGTPVNSFDQTTSNVGDYFASPTSITPLVTYVEAKFLEAEANMRLGNTMDAAMAHNEAIMAHVELITGSPDPTFYANEASETAGTITMDKIMTHKYITNFTKIEAFNDWRRTGIPSLTPPTAAVTPNGAIPRRLITPQDEIVSNPNASIVTNLESPVWWDM